MTRKIVIVEDEDDIREVAQASLELTRGWEVHPASSGAEGVRMATDLLPDAILLDVMMPDMDGPGTLEQIRANPATAEIPVIFLTAKVHSTERARFMDLGAKGVLSKPFDPMKLGEDVAEILGWSD